MTGSFDAPALALEGWLQRLFFRAPGTTEAATATDALFMFVWWHGVFWFVLLMGLMIYWVIKYRRRPGVPAPVSPSHNTALEIFWTVVPSSALLVIFVLGFRGYMAKVTPAGNALEIQITGKKWDWIIRYPNGEMPLWNSTTIDPSGKQYPVYIVPEDTEISLRMISQDVIHSYWIPDLRVKMDVYPNRYTGYGFRTPVLDRDDRYEASDGNVYNGRAMWVFCAEYCGDQHSQMAALMVIVPKATYDAVIPTWDPNQGSPIDRGRRLFETNCRSCHSIDGSKGLGPTWKGGESGGQAYGYGYPVQFEDGTSLDARDADYFRNSILEPQAKRVAGGYSIMSQFGGLSEDNISDLLAFYRSLSDRGGVTGEDGEEGDNAEDGEASTEGETGEAGDQPGADQPDDPEPNPGENDADASNADDDNPAGPDEG